jgi:hypothetical protein
MSRFPIVLLMAWAAPIAAAQSAFLGVELDPNSELGARIVGVQQPSAASLTGLRVDDLIVGINCTRLDSNAGLLAGMQAFLPGEIVTVHIVRGMEKLALPGILGRQPALTRVPPAVPTPQPDAPIQPDFRYLFFPDGTLEWKDSTEIVPTWPWRTPEIGFPEAFAPGPIWSGERPEWMGKDWGAELLFYWQPEMQRLVKLRYPAATPEAADSTGSSEDGS